MNQKGKRKPLLPGYTVHERILIGMYSEEYFLENRSNLSPGYQEALNKVMEVLSEEERQLLKYRSEEPVLAFWEIGALPHVHKSGESVRQRFSIIYRKLRFRTKAISASYFSF